MSCPVEWEVPESPQASEAKVIAKSSLSAGE